MVLLISYGIKLLKLAKYNQIFLNGTIKLNLFSNLNRNMWKNTKNAGFLNGISNSVCFSFVYPTCHMETFITLSKYAVK